MNPYQEKEEELKKYWNKKFSNVSIYKAQNQ